MSVGIAMLVVGYDVAMYARLDGAGLFSVDVHVYGMVDVVEVGERVGYAQSSIGDALDEVRVRAGPYGGFENIFELSSSVGDAYPLLDIW
jgi:hypothetical protein